MFTVTIYDVTDTKRRNTLRKKLKNFGEPVQFSGFEAILRPKQLEKMKEAIRGTIERQAALGTGREVFGILESKATPSARTSMRLDS